MKMTNTETREWSEYLKEGYTTEILNTDDLHNMEIGIYIHDVFLFKLPLRGTDIYRIMDVIDSFQTFM